MPCFFINIKKYRIISITYDYISIVNATVVGSISTQGEWTRQITALSLATQLMFR